MASWLNAISVEDISKTAEDSAFFTPVANSAVAHDPARQARDRQRLDPNLARASQRRKKHALTTKQRVFDPAYKLDIVMYIFGERNNTTGVYLEKFAGLQFTFFNMTA